MAADLTDLLQRAAAGDEGAADDVAARVYAELERFAELQLRRGFGRDLPGITLEPAALVNETFLKLLAKPTSFVNRRHFFAFANRVMLRVLVDYQRARAAKKRGGELLRVTLTGIAAVASSPSALSAALEELERHDRRKAEIVQLRVFWGLAMAEIASTLDVSLRTAERDWRFARSWLRARLEPE